MIGDENPFIIGNSEPICLDKVQNSDFPNVILKKEDYFEFKKNDNSSIETYKFIAKQNDLILYLKKRENSIQIAITSKSNKLLFENVFYTSDGIEFSPFNFNTEKEQYEVQFIGKIFKNLPPVFFGFMDYYFGCSEINVIDKTNETIEILCDNRH